VYQCVIGPRILQEDEDKIVGEITISKNSNILEFEEQFQGRLSEAGRTVTERALAGFDADGSPFLSATRSSPRRGNGSPKIRNTLRCRPGGTLRLPEFRRRAHPHSLRTERTHHRQRHPAIGQADFLQIQPQQCRGRAGGSARNPAPRGVALLHSGPFGIDGRAHRGEIPPAGATVETNLPRRRSPPSPSVSTEPACSSATTATAVLIEISEEWETGKAYLQTAETNPIR